MKKRIWLLFLLTAGFLTGSASADDFEDFIHACARVSANYDRALQSPGTRFDKEFQEHLSHLKKLSRIIQQKIREMQLGQDFNFPFLAREIEQIYLDRQSKSGLSNSAKLDAHSGSPEGVLRVLTDDVKALRKMEFTTEDGGSIKSSLETRRRLNEFRRLVDFFRKNYRNIPKAVQKNDVSLLRIFDDRMMRMSALATVLMETAQKKYPGTQSLRNLQTETLQLGNSFDTWRKKISGASKTARKNKNFKRKNLDGTNSAAALRAEIDLSLRNITDQLTVWEQAGFQSDEPLNGSAKNTRSNDPAAPLLRKSGDTDYDSMDRKELSEILRKRRQRIFRSNSSMDGFDRNTERLYLLTLTRDQKKLYNDYLREIQQQGYSSGQAVRNAILKIHTRIAMDNTPLPVKELIRILKALDREEARRIEQNNIQFKLDRSRSERF